MADIVGYTPEEYYAEPELAIQVIHPDDRKKLGLYVQGKRSHGPVTLRAIHKDGRIVWLEQSVVPIYDDSGNVVALEGIARDITERMRVERELRELQERFRSLVENTNDILWEVDPQEIYAYISPNVEAILGYSPEELIGKTPFELMPEKEAERVGQIFTQIVQEGRPFTSLQHNAVCKDGRVILLECSGKPIAQGEGPFLGYRGIDRDISERSSGSRKLLSVI